MTTGQVDEEAFRLGQELLSVPLWDTESANALNAGVFVAVLTPVLRAATLTTLGAGLWAAGVTASGVNSLGIYDEAGNQLGETGDMSADFAGTPGYVEGTLAAPVAVTALSRVYLTILTHFSGTAPKFGGPLTVTIDYPTFNGKPISGFLTAQATQPATITPAALTRNSGAYLIGAR